MGENENLLRAFHVGKAMGNKEDGMLFGKFLD